MQVNELDRFLEIELRKMLDPVPTCETPSRIQKVAVMTASIEFVTEALPHDEAVAIPAVQPVHLVP